MTHTQASSPDGRAGSESRKPSDAVELSTNLDDFSPDRVAARVEEFGIAKAQARRLQTFMLGVLGGGFIGLGGLYYTFATIEDTLWNSLAGGLAFAIGYIIAVLVGAEVFTSNNLLMMAMVSRKITVRRVLGNWALVIVANTVGALLLIAAFLLTDLRTSEGGEFGERAVELASDKADLSVSNAFALGILGNLFVCLALWVALAGRSVTDKVIGTILPLSAIGAMELEHVVALLYFLPRGILIELFFPAIAEGAPHVSLLGSLTTLVAVVLGNLVGGSLVVALSFQLIYRKPAQQAEHDAVNEG